jgi:hypothetical protein
VRKHRSEKNLRDNVTWTTLGAPVNLVLPSTLAVGFGVTSHSAGNLATGVFDSVTITQP